MYPAKPKLTVKN